MPEDQRQLSTHHLELLALGSTEILGRLPYGSNATLLLELTLGSENIRAVYKPESGERPLWDYPSGLSRREAAAYQLDTILGLNAVPETIVRSDLPFGPGSLQRFVEADFTQHYFSLLDQEGLHSQLARICAFDLIANSGDRKSGHILLEPATNKLFAIDNGLSFHEEPKLRTVIWEFGGSQIDEDILEAAARLASSVPDELALLLSDQEVTSLRRRARRVARTKKLPVVEPDYRHYPWPIV